MSKLISGILEDGVSSGQMSPKAKRTLKRIRRDRKLYFRDKNGSIRLLSKVSENLYDSVIVNFLMGDAEKRYQALNIDVKHWSKLKPVNIEILKQFENEFKQLLKITEQKRTVTLFYNSSWRKLATINLEFKTKTKELKIKNQK